MKKVFIGLGVVIVLLAAAFIYLNNRNRTLSPPGEVTVSSDEMNVSVFYSRPSARNRLIFGEAEEGALLPYGEYWRLGANEPTFIEVSENFTFGDQDIVAGKYVIYAIPRKGEMELRLNSDLRFWGYTEPDYTQDLATTFVRTQYSSHAEQFTIDTEATKRGVELIFTWDKFRWVLPLEKS
ncbi:MAG: DUF2911 domain-containing protein [Ekhidna sp.]|nr:DUF2911 domain-containing protein [Ekhidna sp.]